MKIPKFKTGWLIGLAGGLLFLVIVPMFLPVNPGMKTFSLFLYFYICLEIAVQINISLKKNKEDELRNKQKDEKNSG